MYNVSHHDWNSAGSTIDLFECILLKCVCCVYDRLICAIFGSYLLCCVCLCVGFVPCQVVVSIIRLVSSWKRISRTHTKCESIRELRREWNVKSEKRKWTSDIGTRSRATPELQVLVPSHWKLVTLVHVQSVTHTLNTLTRATSLVQVRSKRPQQQQDWQHSKRIRTSG